MTEPTARTYRLFRPDGFYESPTPGRWVLNTDCKGALTTARQVQFDRSEAVS